jgi:hypothetical protein
MYRRAFFEESVKELTIEAPAVTFYGEQKFGQNPS